MLQWHCLPSRAASSSPSPLRTSQFCIGNSKPHSLSSFSLPCQLSSCSRSFLGLCSLTKQKLLSVKCEYFEQQRFSTSEDSSHALRSPSLVPRPVVRDGALPPRVFVGHSVYKGKAVLTVNPRPPQFVPLESGAYKVSREGYVLLQFAPAVGMRQYDWTRKQVFSLSVPEMGNVISLGMRDSCEFFHDPFKGKSDEGKVRKVLKVEPLPDGSGHFFNLTVQNKLVKVEESIYIPITRAEIAVFKSLFDFIIPYLLGWHTFSYSIRPDEANPVNNGNPRYGGDYEWSR